MLMHCSSGRVTLLWGKFQPPKFSPQWTYGAGQTHTKLCLRFLVFFSFLSRDLRALLAIAAYLSNIVENAFDFMIPIRKFGGSFQKILESKMCKIWFDFGHQTSQGRISSKRRKIVKIGKNLVDRSSSRDGDKCQVNFGSLTTHIQKSNHIFLSQLFRRPYFGPKFLYSLKNDQILIAHIPPRTESSKKFGKREAIFDSGLLNFKASGNNRKKLFHVPCC